MTFNESLETMWSAAQFNKTNVSSSTDITGYSEQNVSLPCTTTENKPVVAVEWIRTDLQDEFVLLYRDDQIDPENQHPSFKNRVDLADRRMKDGDVSLVLMNLTTNDTGTYECRVQSEGSLDAKLIRTINLQVSLHPPPGDKNSANQVGSIGLMVGLILSLLLLVFYF
ncbi:coxsackievirus and adenovirus receptor homolog isoform X1 [Poecilia reticulata]|uniref:coxsackievirus and adenovirus receptor homolog isoform X1 n=1 Tax=Poecilia reticulata TaxID=8081 RepID=UPI0007E9D161|nr:PREDICTED: coxsackievirus and adenovirus receptor homolog isoform X1 [Poecilia reticulata]